MAVLRRLLVAGLAGGFLVPPLAAPTRPVAHHPATEATEATEATDATDATIHRSRQTLTVTTTGRIGVPKVSHRLDGANLIWFGNAGRILTDDGRTIRADTEDLMRQLRLRSLRYPGGTPANLFDHRRFDPSRPAQCQTSGGFDPDPFTSIPDSTYGPGLNARFAHDIGAVTNLMLPLVNTTTALARGFVDTVRAAQTAPLYVEVGNEPYVDSQRYWRSADVSTRLRQYLHGGVAHQRRAEAPTAATGVSSPCPAAT